MCENKKAPTLKDLMQLLKHVMKPENQEETVSNRELLDVLTQSDYVQNSDNASPFTLRMIQSWVTGNVKQVKSRKVKDLLGWAAKDLLLRHIPSALPSELDYFPSLRADNRQAYEEDVVAFLKMILPEVDLASKKEPVTKSTGLRSGSLIRSSAFSADPNCTFRNIRTPEEAAASLLPKSGTVEEDLADYCFRMQFYGKIIPVSYKEVLGNKQKNVMEFLPKDISCTHTGEVSNIAEKIEEFYKLHAPDKSFTSELIRQQDAEAGRGYRHHPAKLWLRDFSASDNNTLHLTFGQIGYLEHRIYRSVLDTKTELPNAERAAFCAVLDTGDGDAMKMENALWAHCGGGVWVITRDNYLILSHRQKVGEIPGYLSYSASGAFNYKTENGEENTPEQAMMKEIREELGVSFGDRQRIQMPLISMGIDLERYLAQFSFYWRSDLTADGFLLERQDARSAAEQNLIFVHIKDTAAMYALLQHCAFEPGAAVSLYRLIQKGILG